MVYQMSVNTDSVASKRSAITGKEAKVTKNDSILGSASIFEVVEKSIAQEGSMLAS